MIGIVGGIGPLAGIDLYKKIVENTLANTDQGHVPVLLASIPNEIVDRTEYLLGNISENPAPALARVILQLESTGATHIGIACNTAHAPQIFEVVRSILEAHQSRVEIVHLIDQTVASIKTYSPRIQRVGLLNTSGSYKTGLYQNKLAQAGLTPIVLDFEQHDALVHKAIYDPETGLKAVPTAHPEAVRKLNEAIRQLQSLGAEAIVLGCTEIGMVEESLNFLGLSVFNPNLILAKSLIYRSFPEKLKP